MIKYLSCAAVLVTSVAGPACTMSDIDPPPLAGPSEMSLSLSLAANPDVLSLDGSSQTLVTIEARDTAGQLVPNIPLRVQILADGAETDFGTISGRILMTGSNGRATFTYTAPPFVSGTIPRLQLGVTPAGTDASAHITRVVTVKLVPPGGFGASPIAVFSFAPEAPLAFTDVRFNGTASTAGLGAVITGYLWDFGDGTSATGAAPSHQYGAAGNYPVHLTVTDNHGRTNRSAPQMVTVAAGQVPTATFVYSPGAPVVGQAVFFNATLSMPGTGHRVVSYRWDWGDGTPTSSGSTVSHTFAKVGTYVVILTVTDEAGQEGRIAVDVIVA